MMPLKKTSQKLASHHTLLPKKIKNFHKKSHLSSKT